MGIIITKGYNEPSKKDSLTSSIVLEMTESIRSFCEVVSVSSKVFDVKKAFELLKQYVNNFDRLLYAEISNYCYHLDSCSLDNFQGNLGKLLEYVYSWNFENGISSLTKTDKKEAELRERTKRIIIKLYDNVNLACAQMSSLKRSEDELREAVKKEFLPLKEDISKDISSQLITLVGIFTAIAFLVFGGFDSLQSIFSSLVNENIPKLIMVSSLWGLVVCNGLFVLLSCIECLIQKHPVKNTRITSSLSQIANLIFLTVFALSAWFYFIDEHNFGGEVLTFIATHKEKICITGFVVIIILFFVGIFAIKKQCKNSNFN